MALVSWCGLVALSLIWILIKLRITNSAICRQVPLFAHLSPAQITTLGGAMTEVSFVTEDFVYEQVRSTCGVEIG